MVSKLERKVIYFYNSGGVFFSFIVIKPHFDETSNDPLGRLLNVSGYTGTHHLFLLNMQSLKNPDDGEIHFRSEFWGYEEFRILHEYLEEMDWNKIPDGLTLRYSEISK